MSKKLQTDADIFNDIENGKYRDDYLVYSRKSTDETENQKNSISYQRAENLRHHRLERGHSSLVSCPAALNRSRRQSGERGLWVYRASFEDAS